MHRIGNDRRQWQYRKLWRSANSELLHGCLNLKKYYSMTKCSLSDDNISSVKNKNPEIH